jgi:hypothetical protein
MAPISKRVSGPTNVYLTVDDEQLLTLLQSLKTISCVPVNATTIVSDNVPLPSEIVTLCTILEPWCKEWLFEEQVCQTFDFFVIFSVHIILYKFNTHMILQNSIKGRFARMDTSIERNGCCPIMDTKKSRM